MVVDDCRAATVEENEYDQSLSEDRAPCEIQRLTPGENKYINVNTPLQLGGRSNPDIPFPSEVTTQGFDGCIKNLIHDGLVRMKYFDITRVCVLLACKLEKCHGQIKLSPVSNCTVCTSVTPLCSKAQPKTEKQKHSEVSAQLTSLSSFQLHTSRTEKGRPFFMKSVFTSLVCYFSCTTCTLVAWLSTVTQGTAATRRTWCAGRTTWTDRSAA